MLGMPVILAWFFYITFAVFWRDFPTTKNNGYLAVIMGVFGVFHLRMQLNDALIAFGVERNG